MLTRLREIGLGGLLSLAVERLQDRMETARRRRQGQRQDILILAASRDYQQAILRLGRRHPDIRHLVHGEELERPVREAARALGWEVVSFPAAPTVLGRKAIPLRNREMLEWALEAQGRLGHSGVQCQVLAVASRQDGSRGTRECLEVMRELGIAVELF